MYWPIIGAVKGQSDLQVKCGPRWWSISVDSSGVRVGHGWATAQGAGYKGVLVH